MLIVTKKIKHVENNVKAYNFQVEDFHTYYVVESCVLVHNADCTIEFNNKFGLDNNEYKQQLSDQQDGLNNLTVEKYQNNRASYEADCTVLDCMCCCAFSTEYDFFGTTALSYVYYVHVNSIYPVLYYSVMV